MKIIEGFNLVNKKLTEAGAESPAFDTSELISFVLDTPYTPALDKEQEICAEDTAKLLNLAERRAKGEPLQYILERPLKWFPKTSKRNTSKVTTTFTLKDTLFKTSNF